jgi:hypothetical protein
MSFRPMYLPATDSEWLTRPQPIFHTEEEAWDYIHHKYCHCGMEIDPNKDGYCLACEAEWMVEEVEIFIKEK